LLPTVVLDAVHGVPPPEIAETARLALVRAMKAGSQLHLELGDSAPAFGDHDAAETFPIRELLRPHFGLNADLHEQFVHEEEKEGGVFVSRWGAHNVVVTTHFGAEDYAELLRGSWAEMPLEEMAVLIVKPEAAEA